MAQTRKICITSHWIAQKIETSTALLSTLGFEPLVIALIEPWLRTDSNKVCLSLPKYQQVQNQRRDSRGSGLGFFVHNVSDF